MIKKTKGGVYIIVGRGLATHVHYENAISSQLENTACQLAQIWVSLSWLQVIVSKHEKLLLFVSCITLSYICVYLFLQSGSSIPTSFKIFSTRALRLRRNCCVVRLATEPRPSPSPLRARYRYLGSKVNLRRCGELETIRASMKRSRCWYCQFTLAMFVSELCNMYLQ